MTEVIKPVLVFVRGMPGSGKTYLAEALKNALGRDNVLMLDPDHIDFSNQEYIDLSKTLSADGLDAKIHPFRWLRTSACKGISGDKVIIWNQPFTDEGVFTRLVEFLQNYAKEHEIDLPVLIVEVNIDPVVAKQRVLRRKAEGGHGPSEDTLNNRIAAHKSYAGSNFLTVAVEGEDAVSTSVAKVTKVLNHLRQD